MKIKDVFAQQIRDVVCTRLEDTTEQPKVENTQTNTLDLPDEDFIPHSDNERTIDL